ncbi:trypsin-like peptidase domain-containing protein [Streptosporangium sp. NPDC004379]|uniref:trypsin-like peptidase domain-containing protein n=1 Tax=Streptosporangium sp. NPDC004379 TaxID=3366189 RepID=UPI003693B84C
MPNEEKRYGSGYRVTSEVVLTAAHVIKDALDINVRFTADRTHKLPATPLWTEGDLAALRVPSEGALPPVRYGLVDPGVATELRCQAVGFPLWKYREKARVRDSAQMTGVILPLENRYGGTLGVAVDRPPAEDRTESPWKGMSGAALFVGDRLVGVLSEHHPREGAGHLTALRVDWASALTPEQRAEIGCSGAVVVNPPPRRRTDDYLTRMRHVVPAGGLRDRDGELAELAAFCRGEEPYLWVRGRPWSGKSALAASFALAPPPEVRVVAFFVSGPTDADADAFLQAVSRQLEAVAGTPGETARLDDLLEEAAGRCREDGERLLLLVDGLDEDEGPDHSIAALLPHHPPEGVRVLVTGRPHPGVPGDVPSGHPLRTCRVRELAPNAHATHMEIEAKNDLQRLIGVPRNGELLGFVAAAQGALTRDDLAALTGLPRYEVERRLGNRVFTRTDDGYLYAHETLYRMAEEYLAPGLGEHRKRIHEWADSYRARGWPEDTPAYLLLSYGRLLTGPRLVDHALDHARHERMRGIVGGGSAAVREITAAQQAVLGEAEPDLPTLARLAVARDRLSVATSPPPLELPVVWVRLGESGRAVRLARSVVDADARAKTLAAVVKAMAEAGEPGAAKAVACSIDRVEQRSWALAAVVKAMADAGETSAAETLARSIEETDRRIWALAAVARASRSAELLDEAERLIPSVVDPDEQAQAVVTLARAAAECGDVARAEVLVHRIPNMGRRVPALSAVLRALAEGDRDRIPAVMKEAEEAAETILREHGQDRALGALVTAIARCGDVARAVALAGRLPPYLRSSALAALAGAVGADGDPKRAEGLVEAIPLDSRRVHALCALAKEVARQGDMRWAADLAEEAEALTRGVASPVRRVRAMVAVAEAFGACADPRAETVASAIDSPHHRVRALAAAAGATPDPGRARDLAEQAEALARTRAPSTPWAQAPAAVAEAFAAVGDLDRAEELALAIPEPAVRTRVLTGLVRLLAGRDVARAEAVARERVSAAEDRDRALAWVAGALATRGEHDRAEELALSLSSADLRAHALALVVRESPDMRRAVAVARRISHADRRDQARVGLVQTMAARGELRRAMALARELRAADHRANALLAVATASGGGIGHDLLKEVERLVRRVPDEGRRTRLLISLVRALAGAGRPGDAERLARAIPSPEKREAALADVAAALVSRGEVRKALSMVRKIVAPSSRAHAYVAVVRALSERGDVAAAFEVAAKEIPTADHLAHAFTVLIRADPGGGAGGKSGEGGKRRAGGKRGDGGKRGAGGKRRAGGDGGAMIAEIVRRLEFQFPARITHPDRQLMAFVEALRAITDGAGPSAARGLADRIEELAARIEDEDRRAQILMALARTVEPPRARRLLARVLSGPAWTAALSALHEAEPRALPAIAGEFLHPRPG